MTHTVDTIESKPIQSIKKYWAVIAFIFVLGGMYKVFTSNAQETKDNANKIETVAQKQNEDEKSQALANAQILIQLSQIQSDIKWLTANAGKKQ